jgi:hypothetical protein
MKITKKLITIFLIEVILVTAGTARAGFTFVSTDTWDAPEKYLEGTGGVLDEIYGWTNLTRIADTPYPGDQISYETDGGAMAVAKYAAHNHLLGYDDGSLTWFTPDPFVVGSSSGIFNTSGTFVWALYDKNDGTVWYSKESLNDQSYDHMVTYKLNTANVPTYIICWEDLNLGDQDYQDLVVEVTNVAPVPEPATLLLLGGAGLVGWMRRRRAL